MLKKVLKTALMAAAVVSMGAPATMALQDGETIIAGRAGSYWGQIQDNNDGVEGEDAVSYLQNSNEFNLRFITLQGAFLGYMEIEARGFSSMPGAKEVKDSSGDTHIRPGADRKSIANINTFIQFMPSRTMDFTFGTLNDLETSSFAVGSGLATFDALPTYKAWGVSHYAEGDGFRFRYKLKDHKIGIALYSDAAASSNGFGFGSAQNIYAGGKFGPIQYRISSVTEEAYDDPSKTSDDESKKDSKSTLIALKYNITPEMSLSVDNYASEIAYPGEILNKNSSTALQFRMKKVGPGNIVATYATTTHEVHEDAKTAMVIYPTANKSQGAYVWNKKVEVADMGLVYEIPMAKNNSRLQVFYMSKTAKGTDPVVIPAMPAFGFDGADGVEFSRKQTMLGAGVFLHF